MKIDIFIVDLTWSLIHNEDRLARVSNHHQSLDLQIYALEKAGCEKIFQEKISGMKAILTDYTELKPLSNGKHLLYNIKHLLLSWLKKWNGLLGITQ
ncbi:recombinase family protein [Bacillus sp. DJP31]|uniref:recombinase family protein n=1 Tax=Bacillus sp. DJP31 TaxID=3409789 RepID=UPI003BB48BF8